MIEIKTRIMKKLWRCVDKKNKLIETNNGFQVPVLQW